MPIVIKEIRVNTVIEKKVILPDEISGQAYLRLKEQIMEELLQQNTYSHSEKDRKKER